jgi:hypothetical protein
VLVDKQGVARAALRHINLDRRYVFAPKAGARFVSLEKNEEQSDLKGLRVTPQTLLGERAVPLGFDYRSELMYYATNVGRDTYAIRAYDVVKKQDTGFVIEHPIPATSLRKMFWFTTATGKSSRAPASTALARRPSGWIRSWPACRSRSMPLPPASTSRSSIGMNAAPSSCCGCPTSPILAPSTFSTRRSREFLNTPSVLPG